MAIIDISTEDEIPAANYSEQCKLAAHWNKYANESNGIAAGEFNIFFIDAKVELNDPVSPITIQGHKQITNYYATGSSLFIKQKMRYSEHTSIETTLGIRVNSFSLYKENFLNIIFSKLLGRYNQLDRSYFLSTSDNNLLNQIQNFWRKTKIYRYTDRNMIIRYNRNNGKLKMKFYKMLMRSNELENLVNDFKILIRELH